MNIINVDSNCYGEFDYYVVETKSYISTKEFIIDVIFKGSKVEFNGSVIAYGDWVELEEEECKSILLELKNTWKMR